MEQVFQFIAKYWLGIVIGITMVFNLVMSIINAAKTGKCVKYSEVVSLPDIQEIVDTVKSMSYGQKFDFFSELQKAMEDEKNGVSKN